jgi:DNA modification methylase
MKLLNGNNLELLKTLEDNSIDSVVTDPPYGLSFMNKKWDYDVPSVEFWKEVYRVLKPGGHILSFGGTRTYHRMVVNIEDAGFEIRDQIMWLYGSGFPKSHNIGKAVDKLEGNEREWISKSPYKASEEAEKKSAGASQIGRTTHADITKGTSPYEGWGTALKPANEPICLARKPLSEKSVALNVLKWATGGINIDGCRIGFLNDEDKKNFINDSDGINRQKNSEVRETYMNNTNIIGNHNINDNRQDGRFPANIILECICDEVIKGEKGEITKRFPGGSTFGGNKMSEKVEGKWFNDKGDIHTNPNCPCNLLDEQSGESKSRSKYPEVGLDNLPMNYYEETKIKYQAGKEQTKEGFTDKGGASRFFYQSKVSKAERNLGLDGFEDKITPVNTNINSTNENGQKVRNDGSVIPTLVAKNNHPTVKPINLMTYLCRLITPKGGVVLDPFMGSGSSGIAALLEGFDFIGMEMDEDYFKIAEGRINNYEQYKKFIK